MTEDNKPITDARPNILITHPDISNTGIDILKIACNLIICKSTLNIREEILKKCVGVDGILWSGSNVNIDAEIIDAAGPQLKVISVLTYNLDYVDLNILRERNIQLGHTPQISEDTVAELAMGLFLAASRRFHEGRLCIDTLQWPKFHPLWLLGADVRGSIIGFFGMNQVGLAIAKHLRGFNIGKFFYTNSKYKSQKKWLNQVNFHKLLTESHFIFIVCPLTSKTKFLFNKDVFSKMKPIMVLINVSNGKIIEQNDLCNALNKKTIFAAGIDSCYPEPLPLNHPLLKIPNLIITPHLRTQTKKTKDELAMVAAENILSALTGKELWSTVSCKKGGDEFDNFDF